MDIEKWVGEEERISLRMINQRKVESNNIKKLVDQQVVQNVLYKWTACWGSGRERWKRG